MRDIAGGDSDFGRSLGITFFAYADRVRARLYADAVLARCARLAREQGGRPACEI